MQRWYFVCEKLPNQKAKVLSVVRDAIPARKALRRFATKSAHEVFLQDVITGKVVGRLNPDKVF
jgi:hypothetical protein